MSNINRAEMIDAEKTYEDGLNEAWALAGKIVANPIYGGLEATELRKLFGTNDCGWILMKTTYQQAAARIKTWKDAHEIRIKDQVVRKDDETKNGVVMAVSGTGNDSSAFVWWEDKSASYEYTRNLIRTGRSIDFESALKQITECPASITIIKEDDSFKEEDFAKTPKDGIHPLVASTIKDLFFYIQIALLLENLKIQDD